MRGPEREEGTECESGAVVLAVTEFELSPGGCVTFDADLAHHFENQNPRKPCLTRRRECRPTEELMPKTLLDKIWDAHEVSHSLIYIDLQLVHEVTRAQAFDELGWPSARSGGRSRTAGTRRPQRP